MEQSPSKPGVAFADIWPLLLGLVCFSMGQTLIFAIAGPIFREIGLAETDLGWVISAAAVSYTLVAPVWGRVSDRYGRLPVLIFGLVGYAGTTIAFALVMGAGMNASLAPLTVFILLLGIRVSLTILSGGVHPATTAFVADRTSGTDRSAGLALTGAAFGIGSVIGPFVGGLLSVYGLLVPLYVSAALCIVAALLILWRMEEPREHHAQAQVPPVRFLDPRIRAYCLMALATFCGVAVIQQTTAFYVQDLLKLGAIETAQAVAWVIGAMAIATLLAQIGIVQFLKPSPRWMLRIGYGAVAVSGLGMLAADNLIGLIAAFALYGLGFGLANPGLTAGASLNVGPEERGATAGIIAAGMGAGFIVGPILGTYLFTLDLRYPSLFIMGLGAALFVSALRLNRITISDPGPADQSAS